MQHGVRGQDLPIAVVDDLGELAPALDCVLDERQDLMVALVGEHVTQKALGGIGQKGACE